MTESSIFEILLQKKYDFPKLNEEAATKIASDFTDIIYSTLKVKSYLPGLNRSNVLKFLNVLSFNPRNNHFGINDQNYHVFIKYCQQQFESNEVEHFLDEVSKELGEKIPVNLCDEVVRFHQMKNKRRQDNIKKIDSIKKHEQEVIDEASFSVKVTRSFSHYETSENLIKKLLDSNSTVDKEENLDISDISYREKQTQFAYGILYLQQWDTLKKILNRFLQYKELTNFEVNFLLYLSDHSNLEIRQCLIEKFIFIYEKIIITFCTKIIQLKEEDEVNDFFAELLMDKYFSIIKELSQNEKFKMKLKHMLFELYTYSFCNNNLLKLIKLF